MKLFNKCSVMMLAGAALLASCSDIDDMTPAGGTHLLSQVKETNTLIPSRADATFNGMYNMMCKPLATYGTSGNRADDFGYASAAFSQDLEGADAVSDDNDYNWFSTALEYSTRTANYANPYMRYKLPYNQIGVCNELINSLPENSNKWAQAKAVRAFAYMSLAPYFAFAYQVDPNAPCVPLLTDGCDYTNNPRATVAEVYEFIIKDLDEAIAVLDQDNTLRGTNKLLVDKNVAYGLRARANLLMGNYEAAANDADVAMEGYSPASIADVSKPSFCQIAEENWIWGYEILEDMTLAGNSSYATPSSWVSSFSGNGYAPATGTYACINTLLYNKISDTDIRKQWWVDENLHSSLLNNLTWTYAKGSASGQNIATLAYDDKLEFTPYTNVKFGMKTGIGSTINTNDWPLMRVEEMILIKAEGLARTGKEDQAKQVLINFVKTNRDPSYSVDDRGLGLLDEIWFQRRVELWGEGFYVMDMKRLQKPLVRFHNGVPTNCPDAFKFNMRADDGWLNMRFPQREMDNNKGIIDNFGGNLPVPGQEPGLYDGVTD